ncbi:hypothetical protein WDU94_008033 [Cyamophila willieti]
MRTWNNSVHRRSVKIVTDKNTTPWSSFAPKTINLVTTELRNLEQLRSQTSSNYKVDQYGTTPFTDAPKTEPTSVTTDEELGTTPFTDAPVTDRTTKNTEGTTKPITEFRTTLFTDANLKDGTTPFTDAPKTDPTSVTDEEPTSVTDEELGTTPVTDVPKVEDGTTPFTDAPKTDPTSVTDKELGTTPFTDAPIVEDGTTPFTDAPKTDPISVTDEELGTTPFTDAPVTDRTTKNTERTIKATTEFGTTLFTDANLIDVRSNDFLTTHFTDAPNKISTQRITETRVEDGITPFTDARDVTSYLKGASKSMDVGGALLRIPILPIVGGKRSTSRPKKFVPQNSKSKLNKVTSTRVLSKTKTDKIKSKSVVPSKNRQEFLQKHKKILPNISKSLNVPKTLKPGQGKSFHDYVESIFADSSER